MKITEHLQRSIRMLRTRWLVNLAIVLTMVVLVTFSAVIVSAVYGAFAGPLPYGDYDHLAMLTLTDRKSTPQTEFSYADLDALSRDKNAISQVGAYADPHAATLSSAAGSLVVNVVSVSSSLLPTCMVPSWRGRLLSDDSSRDATEAVVSHQVWQHLQSRNSELPQTVALDGVSYQVVGVLPPSFQLPLGTQDEVFTPIVLNQQQKSPTNRWLHVLARFAQGVTVTNFGFVPMNSVLESGANADGLYLSAEPIRRAIMGDDREALLVTSAGLLITVAFGVITLIGLLLMRVVYRIRDIALRIGLGARQLDLAKSFASDGVLLCAAAALASMVTIVFANRVLQAVAGEQLARLGVASLSARMIVLVGLVILALAESVCILPTMFFYGQSTLSRMLRSEGASRGRGQKLLGKSLAIAQLSMTCALLLLSALITWRAHTLVSRDWGFNPSRVLTTDINLEEQRYKGKDLNADFYEPLLSRIRTIPGVESAGLIQMLPVQESGWTENIALQGIAPVSQTPQAEYRIVSPGYFNVFHVRLQAGRLLQQEIDRPETQAAAVVNAAFVRKFVPPGTNPLGLKVQDDQDSIIVGVTSDVRQDLFSDAKPEIDYVMSQIPPRETLRVIKKLHLVVGTAAETPDLSHEISLALREIDPTLPDRPVITMETVINSAVGSQRTQQWIFISFAVAALILGGIGIYVLFAQEIEEEKRQLAIRIALGAPRAHILTHLMFQILRIALSGMVVGAAVAIIALAKMTDAVAYTRPAEAASLCVVIGIVAVTSVCAGLAPAVRMMLSDPLGILKV